MITFEIRYSNFGQPIPSGQNWPFTIHDLNVSPPRAYGATWDWGDGSPNTPDPSLGGVHHDFTAPGTYTVTSTVTANNGSDSGSEEVDVTVV